MAKLNKEFELTFKKYDEISNKALDFLIASWKETGERKEIALIHYKKYKQLAKELAIKLNEFSERNLII